ncbi:MAG: hypothetical protein ABI371_02740 [Gelidibacter sp.]
MEDHDLDYLEPRGTYFDFRGYLFKALNLWKFVLLSVAFALFVAYLINVRKQNIYKLDSLISVESDQNPFFTANTSISFNWGGVSGKVGKVLTSVKTRTHNELVVDSLQYYMEYLEQGKYRMEDIYKNAPFIATLDKTKGQILEKTIGIKFIDDTKFEMTANFEKSSFTVQRYSDKEKYNENFKAGEFAQTYNFGQVINLPFFNGTITKRTNATIMSGSQYFLQFINFDAVVNEYKNSVMIAPFSGSSSSVLTLSLAGSNKAKIVDYLNATTSILSKTELERKNLYATNTIKFIDSSLNSVNDNLKDVTDEMNKFRKENKLFDITEEMNIVSGKLRALDLIREEERTKLNYLNALENYLRTKTDYTQIAAPTSVGINESNILSSVAKITALAIERQTKEYTVKEGNLIFKDIDRQIDAEKNVLLETIGNTKRTIGINLDGINGNIAKF